MAEESRLMSEEKIQKPDKLRDLCRHVLNNEHGKKLLKELKKRVVERQIWAPGQPDSPSIYFLEGQRNTILMLIQLSEVGEL